MIWLFETIPIKGPIETIPATSKIDTNIVPKTIRISLFLSFLFWL